MPDSLTPKNTETARRLYRSVNDRWFYGVIGGIAKYFGVDSTLLRIIFIVIGHGGGSGVLAYFLLAMYLPEDPTETKGDPSIKKGVSPWKILLFLILIPIGVLIALLFLIVILGAVFGVKSNLPTPIR